MRSETTKLWSLVVSGEGIVTAFGTIMAVFYPYLSLLHALGRGRFSFAWEMVSIVATAKQHSSIGFGLLIGMFTGGATTVIVLIFRQRHFSILLLSPVALLCGIIAAGVFSPSLLRGVTETGEAEWIMGSMFSPAAAFCAAVSASLHAGLWTCFSLTRRQLDPPTLGGWMCLMMSLANAVLAGTLTYPLPLLHLSPFPRERFPLHPPTHRVRQSTQIKPALRRNVPGMLRSQTSVPRPEAVSIWTR